MYVINDPGCNIVNHVNKRDARPSDIYDVEILSFRWFSERL